MLALRPHMKVMRRIALACLAAAAFFFASGSAVPVAQRAPVILLPARAAAAAGPSVQSMQYLDQFEGLPNDAELEREIAEAAGDEGPEPERKPALPPRFTRRSSGWK